MALFDIALSEINALQLIAYLSNGSFWDELTIMMGGKILGYNQVLKAFGQMKFECRGLVCSCFPEVFPDISPNALLSASKLIALSAHFLTILIFIFVARVTRNVNHESSWLRFWNDTCITAFQLSSFLCLMLHIVNLRTAFGDTIRHEVYESLDMSGARWLLTKRAETQDFDLVQASILLFSTARPWEAPRDDTGIRDLVRMYNSAEEQIHWYYLHHTLPMITITWMILTWMHVASVIPQVSRTIRTILSSFAHLFHLLVVYSVVLIGYAFMANIAFGDRIKTFSTLSRAIPSMIKSMLVEGGTDSRALVMEAHLEVNTAEKLMIGLFGVTMPILFVFLILNFVMAILMDTFEAQKAVSDELIASQKELFNKDLAWASNRLSALVALMPKLTRSLYGGGRRARTLVVPVENYSWSSDESDSSTASEGKSLNKVQLMKKAISAYTLKAATSIFGEQGSQKQEEEVFTSTEKLKETLDFWLKTASKDPQKQNEQSNEPISTEKVKMVANAWRGRATRVSPVLTKTCDEVEPAEIPLQSITEEMELPPERHSMETTQVKREKLRDEIIFMTRAVKRMITDVLNQKKVLRDALREMRRWQQSVEEAIARLEKA
ncbi:hypothetical protein BSKO_10340 [Bryopsis sp. KO-2023]|nr:hypothetical protein BSKO_10340 [Bryopsis sp. KO-2023]